MTELGLHHSYHGYGIDMEVVHRQGRERMEDSYTPQSTVVHDHQSDQKCEGYPHSVYNHHTRLAEHEVYVVSGTEMWGVSDPVENAVVPPMTRRRTDGL